MLGVILLILNVGIITARRSPQADNVEKVFGKNTGSQFPDDVFKDALLAVPELVRKYNYTLEIHSVITRDGYILELHRIPSGRDSNAARDSDKPVVFLMHGLLCSSADWVLMGPGKGFAYILAEEGFDVWMGNFRGNYYSRRHIRYNPDSITNTDFWKFSWDEMGDIDLPAMIDYVLLRTGKRKLHYVGHSQGTTAFFVMGSLHPEYNKKIISMHALAPVAYMAHNQNRFLKVISPYSNNVDTVATLLGKGEYLPNTVMFTLAGQALCRDQVVFQPICSNILFLISGWNVEEHNTTMIPVIMGHTPAGSSIKQFVHFGQSLDHKEFRRFDFGNRYANWKRYGSRQPPSYDLSRVTAPVYLHYCQKDPLSHVEDVKRLERELGNAVGVFLIPLANFGHLDYLYAIRARVLLYDRVIRMIRTADSGVRNEISTYNLIGDFFGRNVSNDSF